MTFGYYSYRYPNLMNHIKLIIERNDITKVIFYFNFFMTITPKLLIAIP